MKQSGGYVWVYSEPGHGATFKIYLPRIEDEGSAPSRENLPRHALCHRGSSEMVLLVEDEKGVRELAREYLETSGYRVIEAEDGHTALELAAMHAGTIDVLLTDVVMPGIGGRELAERVAQIRPGNKDPLYDRLYRPRHRASRDFGDRRGAAAKAVHAGDSGVEAARDPDS